MFKPGQLVQSEATDEIYLVLCWPQLKSVKYPVIYTARHTAFTLIGNNYRPLSSAAKAKRRYNEMASKVARGEAGYQPAVKSPLSKSCGDKFGDMPKLR